MKLSEHFSDTEFMCKCGCGESVVDARLVKAIQEIRYQINAPITINSGYRCSKHNAAVGGEKNSQHMRGTAADISSPVGIDVLRGVARTLPSINGIGYDPARGFLHVDVRAGKRVEWTYVNGKAVIERLV